MDTIPKAIILAQYRTALESFATNNGFCYCFYLLFLIFIVVLIPFEIGVFAIVAAVLYFCCVIAISIDHNTEE